MTKACTASATNGGVTWSVLERRLDKAPVLDGTPFLASKRSGTQRIGSEQAVTDALGVRRSGSYGTALNSMLNPLRGDAGVEETLRQLQTQVQVVEFGSKDDEQMHGRFAGLVVWEARSLNGKMPGKPCNALERWVCDWIACTLVRSAGGMVYCRRWFRIGPRGRGFTVVKCFCEDDKVPIDIRKTNGT